MVSLASERSRGVRTELVEGLVGLDCQIELIAHGGPAQDPDRLALERIGPRIRVRGDGLDGTIDERFARLDVHGGPANSLAALRLCAALWLPQHGGFLLHGACVEHDGRALAFLGPSGAGKTTLAARLQRAGLRVISDEVTAVRDGRVFGHPFPRRLGDGRAPPDGLPLRAIALLSHAPPLGPSAVEVPPAHTLAPAPAAHALFARTFLPLRDALTLALALEVVARLVASIPVRAIALPDDDRAVALALEAAR